MEADFRKDFLQKVCDAEVVYYWEKELPLLTGKPQAPILTRLDTFLRCKVVRHMVAQNGNLDFRAIMDGRQILLAKLSQGLIGEENSYLLGALLVSKLNQMALSRQQIQASERTPFYIDDAVYGGDPIRRAQVQHGSYHRAPGASAACES